MAPRLAAGLGTLTMLVLAARSAHASPVSEEQRAFLVTANERSDAWLHDRCAFRGLVDPSAHDAAIAGQVLELIADGQSPLVKEFRCAERPPFLKGTFTPAAPEALACTGPKDPKNNVVCTLPLRPPPPPSPIAPTPPKKHGKAGAKKKR